CRRCPRRCRSAPSVLLSAPAPPPVSTVHDRRGMRAATSPRGCTARRVSPGTSQSGPLGMVVRSEEHTSELQSRENLVCRLLLEKKKKKQSAINTQWTPHSYRREQMRYK